jgi:hypothetical protein
MHLGRILDASWTHLGRILDALGTHPGCTWDASRTHLRHTRDALGTHLGCTWDALGTRSGCTLDAPWMYLDAPLCQLSGTHLHYVYPGYIFIPTILFRGQGTYKSPALKYINPSIHLSIALYWLISHLHRVGFDTSSAWGRG